MNLFDVYPLYNIVLDRAKNSYLWDKDNKQYLDLYGGHGVISIGHSHPHYVSKIKDQLDKIGFYSNSVINNTQIELACKLGQLSNCLDYNLFLCNSGAEANENALKLASFHNSKKRIIAFKESFHGRTSAAVAATDNHKIQAEINRGHRVDFVELNDFRSFEIEISKGDVSAVIIEGIQGVGGLDQATTEFFQYIQTKCRQFEALLILDEVQSGYGRSGKFFAFQHHNIKPDIISIAKGMGNGFPVAGILIADHIQAKHGMLGTTFGGNYLAMAASIAVLEVIESENLMDNAADMEIYFKQKFKDLPGLKKIKGRGLMLGLEFDYPIAELRKTLSYKHRVLTGSSSNPNLLRILPALNAGKSELDKLYHALIEELN